MAKKIFIGRDGKREGPYSPKEVRERVGDGRLHAEDLGWFDGAPDWMPLHEIRELQPLPTGRELAVFSSAPLVLERAELVASQTGARLCPFCAEEIKPAALKCRHCGEALDPRLRAMEEAKRSAGQRQGNVYVTQTVQGAAVNREYPHVAHLLVTIFTGGLWIPIWLLCYLARDRERYP